MAAPDEACRLSRHVGVPALRPGHDPLDNTYGREGTAGNWKLSSRLMCGQKSSYSVHFTTSTPRTSNQTLDDGLAITERGGDGAAAAPSPLQGLRRRVHVQPAENI